ncbi:MAG: MFS transporter [Anaerolineales bacterium]|jgi:MFS family permease
MRGDSLVALGYRDFRLLWFGQLISTAGSQMQSAALLWQIYAITHSPMDLGLIGLTRLVPMTGFSLISGLMADAMDRRRLMVMTQSGMAAGGAGGRLGRALVWGSDFRRDRWDGIAPGDRLGCSHHARSAPL